MGVTGSEMFFGERFSCPFDSPYRLSPKPGLTDNLPFDLSKSSTRVD